MNVFKININAFCKNTISLQHFSVCCSNLKICLPMKLISVNKEEILKEISKKTRNLPLICKIIIIPFIFQRIVTYVIYVQS